ncbi:hypothetical protein [Arthrobacter sp. JCM 19049]|uniref:hypothetical protein n=1 Tax=Arthrobacter sp. JCM 19049 TaxID=1460643 RepID=UPI0024365D62|nr:hypothetical protein [Arthrobacter sp. JCM 19049]
MRQALQSGLHGSAGQAQLLGQHHDRHPGIIVQRQQDPPVGFIELIRLRDHGVSPAR